MVSLGIIGEYIGSIQTTVQNRPLVIERERINFDAPAPEGLLRLQEAVRQTVPQHAL